MTIACVAQRWENFEFFGCFILYNGIENNINNSTQGTLILGCVYS